MFIASVIAQSGQNAVSKEVKQKTSKDAAKAVHAGDFYVLLLYGSGPSQGCTR